MIYDICIYYICECVQHDMMGTYGRFQIWILDPFNLTGFFSSFKIDWFISEGYFCSKYTPKQYGLEGLTICIVATPTSSPHCHHSFRRELQGSVVKYSEEMRFSVCALVAITASVSGFQIPHAVEHRNGE